MTDEAIPPEATEPGPAAPERLVFDDEERRVLGVLIEKGLTNPQSYPLTMNALVSGCNQRSNRDPIVHYDDVQVEDILQRLQQRGFATRFYPGEGGRVGRFRQDLGKVFELRGVELAVIGELFLRGPQSVGELRQRASRMRDIPGLPELQEILDKLASHTPPFIRRLTPPGVSRGVRYTHTCYGDAELEQIEAAEAAPARAAAPAPARSAELDDLKTRVDELEHRIARLELALGQQTGE